MSASSEVLEAIDAAKREAKALRTTLKKKKTAQVWSQDERAIAKATALAWFNTHRPLLAAFVQPAVLEDTTRLYKKLLEASEKAAARSTYDACLKQVDTELSGVRTHVLLPPPGAVTTSDEPPDFSSLVKDKGMQAVLVRRWRECCACLGGKAPLAGTVMMGGLLEALLLARANSESDQSKVFKAKGSPKDSQSDKPLPLKSWTLRHYIDVAHELEWISQSAKDVGKVLRDYRNYIHPHKEHSHSVTLTMADAEMFWEITKRISRHLLACGIPGT